MKVSCIVFLQNPEILVQSSDNALYTKVSACDVHCSLGALQGSVTGGATQTLG